MQGRRSLDGVLLDATGTLIRPRESVAATYARMARQFGIEADPIALGRAFGEVFASMPELAFHWESMDDLRRRERAWWRTLVRRVVGLTSSACGDFDGYFDALYAYYARGEAWECFDDAPTALCALRAGGRKLAVVSNFDSRLPRILGELGIGHLLDAIVYSSKARCTKPDPAIFARAISELGVAAERVIHVGDSPRADLAGAAAAGIAGLLICRDGTPRAPSEIRIGSLTELVDRLARADESAAARPGVDRYGRD